MVFPTYVGVFPYRLFPHSGNRSLPHVRGGVSVMNELNKEKGMSSPRTWGCFLLPPGAAFPREVFPTYVGVFPLGEWIRGDVRGLPHVRGGVSYIRRVLREGRVSSPRTWGCFHPRGTNFCAGRVFPTYVGVFLNAGTGH